MSLLTFDDGSTLETEGAGTSFAAATPSTDPGVLSPGAATVYNPAGAIGNNWSQAMQSALLYGFGRWIDSSMPVQGTAATPVTTKVNGNVSQTQGGQTIAGMSPMMLLGLGLAALLVLK